MRHNIKIKKILAVLYFAVLFIPTSLISIVRSTEIYSQEKHSPKNNYALLSYDTDNYIHAEINKETFIKNVELAGLISRELQYANGHTTVGLLYNNYIAVKKKLPFSLGLFYSRIFLETNLGVRGTANVYIPQLKIGDEHMFILYKHMLYIGNRRLFQTNKKDLGFEIEASLPINLDIINARGAAFSIRSLYSNLENKTSETYGLSLQYEHNNYVVNIKRSRIKSVKTNTTNTFTVVKKFEI